MAGICVHSEFVGEIGDDPFLWWDHSSTKTCDIFNSWEAVPRRIATNWQYTINRRGTAADRQSSQNPRGTHLPDQAPQVLESQLDSLDVFRNWGGGTGLVSSKRA